MTPDRTDPMHDDTPPFDDNAVLSDAGNLDTAGIGILGSGYTAQVSVSLPDDPDEDADDGVVDDGVPFVDSAADLKPRAEDHPGAEAVHDAIEGEYVDPELPVEDLDTHTAEVMFDVDEPTAAAVPVARPVDDAGSVTEAGPVAAMSPGREGPLTSGPVPTTRREVFHTGGVDRTHDTERVAPPRQEVALTSKRLGEFEGGRESSDLLTADRLLDHRHIAGPEPEGSWQRFVYTISGHRINLGDSKRARARKELDRRIAAPLQGGARFVPVVSRKGGVGKTTVTTLLGMALADARDDRVIAIDANPDRGTLAERIARPSGRTVRDLARTRGDVNGYNDISTIVTRDETRLDVLASDSDPRVSEAFSDRDYHDVASLVAHYYSIVLTDTGTGIVHSVMGATLELADQMVVVAGLSLDEARLASETLNWLETNGFAEQVRNTVVVLNNARPGTPLLRADELEAHFRSRVRTVVRMPYDPQIATGSAITFRELQPATRQAARDLAAAVVEGLRGLASAA